MSNLFPIMLGSAAIYQVHDNGGRPFTVLVDENPTNGTCVLAYSTREFENESGDIVNCNSEHYQQFPPQPEELLIKWENVVKVWVASCPSLYADESESLGNALLLQLPTDASSTQQNTYVYIGTNICKFTTETPIIAFDSTIGNNDVSYSAALSADEAFFLGDMLRLPRAEIKDPVLGPDDEALKQFSSEVLQWICIYDNLYGTPEEQLKWRAQGFFDHPEAKPLQGYEEVVERP